MFVNSCNSVNVCILAVNVLTVCMNNSFLNYHGTVYEQYFIYVIFAGATTNYCKQSLLLLYYTMSMLCLLWNHSASMLYIDI